MQPAHNSKHRQVDLRQQQCHHCGCSFVTGSPSVTVCDWCLANAEDSLGALAGECAKDLKP